MSKMSKTGNYLGWMRARHLLAAGTFTDATVIKRLEEQEIEAARKSSIKRISEVFSEMYAAVKDVDEDSNNDRRLSRDILVMNKISTQLERKKEEARRDLDDMDRWLRGIVDKFVENVAKPLVYDDDSLSTTRVRQRLSELMGSDVIRLNDKRYFQQLSDRLQQEYDAVMDKQEEHRADSENQRLRRLMLEGLIDAPNDYIDILHDHGKSTTKKKKKRRKSKRHASAYTNNESVAISRYSDDASTVTSRKEEMLTQMEMLSDSRPQSTRCSNKSRRADDRRSTRTGHDKYSPVATLNNIHSLPPHHEHPPSPNHRRLIKSAAPRISKWDAKETTTPSPTSSGEKEFDTQSTQEKSSKVKKTCKYSLQEPQRVAKLRNEETVSGLYSMAETLVKSTGVIWRDPGQTNEQVRVYPEKELPVYKRPALH